MLKSGRANPNPVLRSFAVTRGATARSGGYVELVGPPREWLAGRARAYWRQGESEA